MPCDNVFTLGSLLTSTARNQFKGSILWLSFFKQNKDRKYYSASHIIKASFVS